MANGIPMISSGSALTLGQGKSGSITGIGFSETGNTTGETFTVTISDTSGLLSATGAGVTGSGSTSLTVAGSRERHEHHMARSAALSRV